MKNFPLSHLENLCKRHENDGNMLEAEKAKKALQAHQDLAEKATTEINIGRQNAEFGFRNSKMYKNVNITQQSLERLAERRQIHRCNIAIQFRIDDLEKAKFTALEKECRAHFQQFRKSKLAMVKVLTNHYHYDHSVPFPKSMVASIMPSLEKPDIKLESEV